MKKRIDPFALEIMWKRLIAAADEAATALVRTAFSATVRDANDYGIGLFDAERNLVAQCTLGTPGLIGATSVATKAISEAFPPETLREGDVLIANDPWISGGHLNDVNIVLPIFHKGRIVAYAGCIAHQLDIGGRLLTTETREIYEEGLFIPTLKLYEEGRPNETAFRFLRANIRMADQVIGDLRAQMAANNTMRQRLLDLLDEYGMDDIQELSREITSRTEAAVRAAISQLPEGTCSREVLIDKFDGEPVKIAVTVTLKDGEILIDYSGSSRQLNKGVNVCLSFTKSCTGVAAKCVLAPLLPSNEGGFRPVKVVAPEGSVLNCRYPAPVNSRTNVAQFLAEIVFSALSELIPDKVMAGSGSSPTWAVNATGHRRNGRQFMIFSFWRGGLGGRPGSDGISILAFPGNGACTPSEIIELSGPVVVEKTEFRTDSGGAGKYRGGLGQHVVLRIMDGGMGPVGAVETSVTAGRIHYEVPGLLGGDAAARGAVLVGGDVFNTSGKNISMLPGGRLELFTPGGGGYGNPLSRDVERVEADVQAGLVSVKAARELYGVVLDGSTMKADLAATKEQRMRLALARDREHIPMTEV